VLMPSLHFKKNKIPTATQNGTRRARKRGVAGSCVSGRFWHPLRKQPEHVSKRTAILSTGTHAVCTARPQENEASFFATELGVVFFSMTIPADSA
jgi:hypothetical protein